ncbi:MAG: elongation factor P [Bacteroidota bacterium]
MANMSDIRNGLTFRQNGEIYTVVEFQHVKQARSASFVRAKIKSLTSGKMLEETFNKSSKIDDIRVERHKYQYLYDEGDFLIFMNGETFEQVSIEKEMIAAMDLLKEGETVEVLFDTSDDSPLTVDMPQHVIREVIHTEPGLRGDTATKTMKPAKVEGGATIKVPLFINIGDKIKIETASKAYMERVKG